MRKTKIDKNHVARIEMFANLIGANVKSRWDLGMQFEAQELFLETLVRVRKGQTPLLPFETVDFGKSILLPTIDVMASIDVVCSKMNAVDRGKMKVEIQVRKFSDLFFHIVTVIRQSNIQLTFRNSVG